MLNLTRRSFLKSTAAGAAFLPCAGISTLAFAEAARDILVVVFLRGGCDSLNLVAPVNDPNYTSDRPPEMRVLDMGDKAGIPLANGLDRAVDFRWHNEAVPLNDLYKSGHLGVVYATGLENGTRSHFVAQNMMELGVADDASTARVDSGWLARALRAGAIDGPGTAISATAGVVRALDGYGAAMAVPNLGGGIGLPGGDQTQAVLRALYPGGQDQLGHAVATSLGNIDIIQQHLPKGADGKAAAYTPDNNAAYDGNELGNGLQTVARLIKMDIGLHVAAVDFGGWDTHENQPGRFANQVKALAKNLAAFTNDTSRYQNRITLVTMSEFGRRLRSNKSNGTDHGHAGLMMVMGGNVNGGRMYGRWPGLASEQLDKSVDMAATTDYRAVLSEVLAARFSSARAMGQIFPAYAAPRPMGLLRV
jgi:uncharacterized protein (DUF1501 family)